MTTFSPRRCDPHCPRGDREALARGGVALLAGTHRIPGLVSLGTSTPMCPRGELQLTYMPAITGELVLEGQR